MLDRRCNDVIALVPKRERDPLDSLVVGLAPRAREDDLPAEQANSRATCLRAFSTASHAG
jgi:hypothetical protein